MGWSAWQPGYLVSADVPMADAIYNTQQAIKVLADDMGSYPQDPTAEFASLEAFLDEDGTLEADGGYLYAAVAQVLQYPSAPVGDVYVELVQGYAACSFDALYVAGTLDVLTITEPSSGERPGSVAIPSAERNSFTTSDNLVQFESDDFTFHDWGTADIGWTMGGEWATVGTNFFPEPDSVPLTLWWTTDGMVPSVLDIFPYWPEYQAGHVFSDFDVPTVGWFVANTNVPLPFSVTGINFSGMPAQASVVLQERHQGGELAIPAIDMISDDCEMGVGISWFYWGLVSEYDLSIPATFTTPRWRYWTAGVGPTSSTPPLRLGQRYDGKGPFGHARLVPGTGPYGRVGNKNVLI